MVRDFSPLSRFYLALPLQLQAGAPIDMFSDTWLRKQTSDVDRGGCPCSHQMLANRDVSI